ncbi:MAG: MoaD/ThiS family protein [Candidatus Thorarchaeota archaeon]
MENSQISGNLIIMLNMKDISTLDGLNTTIEPNDEIIILPHVQGG